MAVSNSEATPARVAARKKFTNQSAYIFARDRAKQKLTPHQRDEIVQRYLNGEKPIDLCVEYGVSRSYVHHLASR
jgi:DNA-directed RNA polymerase specialized sigma24 family protein